MNTETPRILFLDDDPRRAALFLDMLPKGTTVLVTEDATNAIRVLRVAHFDWVFLDHDLEHGPFRPSEGANTGAEVARFIEAKRRMNPAEFIHTQFVIHSNNPGGCAEMYRLINDEWFRCTVGNHGPAHTIVAPFGTWTFDGTTLSIPHLLAL